jgi:galactan endo-1,6-beta-galactosidase
MNRKRIGKANPKYFVLAQYSRHILPGRLILSSRDPDTVAAVDLKAGKLVIVAFNPEPVTRRKVYDVSRFNPPSRPVRGWVTQPRGSARYEERTAHPVKNSRFETELPSGSIQTFEIDVTL